MGRKKDWTGQKVGRLTISKRIGTHTYPSGAKTPLWLSHCECGKSRNITSLVLNTAVRQKQDPACGECPKGGTPDILGKKIGLLFVKEFSGYQVFPSGMRDMLFLCRCDCGNEVERGNASLRGALIKKNNASCGCVSIEKQSKYIGKKIGLLRVISKNSDNISYDCECDCGRLVNTITGNLERAVKTKSRISCGCLFKKISIGDKFGRLTVISKAESLKRSDGGGNRGQWNCVCECGNSLISESTNLTLGKVKSCGCLYSDGSWRVVYPPFSYLEKYCPRCNQSLSRKDFGKDGDRPGGLKSLCRKCNYGCKDLAKVTVSNYLRKGREKVATPDWVEKDDLIHIFQERISLESSLDKKLNVDHIIPLIHPLFCGLNVPWNLQITSQYFNTSKGNKFSDKDLDDLEEDTVIENGVRLHCSVFE